MIVYHGSTLIINKPLVNFSKRHLDFGIGFYVTKNKELAERRAKRKKDLLVTNKSIVSVFDLNEKYKDCKYLNFDKMDKAWLDFVCDCRNGLDKYKEFEVIEGPIANDKVFAAVDLYRKSVWDAERAIKELSFIENAFQICIINQEFLNINLSFKEYYEV